MRLQSCDGRKVSCSYLFVVTPYYDADTGIGQELDGEEMWLTVDENGEYKLHFWENDQLVEQIVEDDMISIMKVEMEVREE